MLNMLISMGVAAGATGILASAMKDRRGAIRWFVWCAVFTALTVIGLIVSR